MQYSTISTISIAVLSFPQPFPANSPVVADPAELQKWLSLPLNKLAPREREVAMIVYGRGACTANAVQAELSARLSNGAVRSMLVRLVRKGILVRRWGKRGRGQEYVYLPAITPVEVKQRALREVTEKYFDGSLTAVALGVLELIDDQLSKRPSPAASAKAATEVVKCSL